MKHTYDVYCYERRDTSYRSRMVIEAKTAVEARTIAKKSWYDPRGKIVAERRAA